MCVCVFKFTNSAHLKRVVRYTKMKKQEKLGACRRVFVGLAGPTTWVHHTQAGGTFPTPCLCSSPITLSTEGGLRPRGSGSHGLVKTSPIAASILSLD
jgi:hypothetical protein